MAMLLIKGLCKEWRVSAGGVRTSVCVFLQERVYLEPREIHTHTNTHPHLNREIFVHLACVTFPDCTVCQIK